MDVPFSLQGIIRGPLSESNCTSYNLPTSLTLKVPRKKMHLKMSSAEVVCWKKLPNITDELSIEANSVDPEQTAPIGAV